MDIITTHQDADFDALASMVAAKKLYPDAKLIFPGSQERAVRRFLTLCSGLVKIEMEREAHLEGVRRLIVVETRDASRLGRLGRWAGQPGVELHLFDHHPRTPGDLRGTVDVYRRVGATTTILAGLLRKAKITLTPLEATILALGIYEDTGSLTFPSTTRQDVEAVATLLSQGANLVIVSRYLQSELTPEDLELLSRLLQKTRRVTIHGIDIAISTAQASDYVEDLSLLAHKLLDIENFPASFILVKIDSKIQVVARSRLEFVDVGRVLRRLGGGGHPFAASGVVRTTDPAALERKILQTLERVIPKALAARDLMRRDVPAVSQERKVTEIAELLSRRSLEGVPVVRAGRLAGVVTHHDLEKALHHGFGHSRIKGYMSAHPISVLETAPWNEIQRLFDEHRIGHLPVVGRSGRLVGFITRTDLFRGLHRDLFAKPSESLKAAQAVNLGRRMRRRLSRRTLRLLFLVGRAAETLGIKAYAVGGLVRDLLLGVPNGDLDLVVEGDAIRLARALRLRTGGRLVVHPAFGTAAVRFEDGSKIDLASARREVYERPAALPKVSFSSLRDDLFRRDFTINAMAVSLSPGSFGDLVDFFGGRRDLQNRRVRILHNLSFVEDPTRIFRAIRFESRLGFEIERSTEHLMREAALLKLVRVLSPHRLKDEIVLILKEEKPLPMLERIEETIGWRFLSPGLRLDARRRALLESIEEALAWFHLNFLSRRSLDGWLVRWMGLLDGVSVHRARALSGRLGFSRSETERLVQAARLSRTLERALDRPGRKPSDIYRILDPVSTEALLFMLARLRSPRAKKRILEYWTLYNKRKLSITGRDLEAAGIPAGPHFRKILDATLEAKLDGKVRTRRQELCFAQSVWRRLKSG